MEALRTRSFSHTVYAYHMSDVSIQRISDGTSVKCMLFRFLLDCCTVDGRKHAECKRGFADC